MGKDLDPGRVPAQVTNVTHRGAGDIISHDDLSKIIAYAKLHPSKSGACIQLEKLLGIRVGDMAYGMKIKDDFLEIKCKNGKILIRRITSEMKSVLSSDQFLSMMYGSSKRGTKFLFASIFKGRNVPCIAVAKRQHMAFISAIFIG